MKKTFLIVLTVILGLGGCLKNPVATRDAQDPAGSTGTWDTPATPEQVLINMIYAYNEKNIQNYQLCFANDFIFSATEDSIEAEAQGNGYLFRGWDKSVEVSVTENLFPSFTAEGNSLDMVLSPSSDYPDSIGDSLAVMYREYSLRIVTADSLDADTTIIQGLVSFSSSRNPFNWWSIYFWQEIPFDGTDYSWANLKAEYRN